MIVWVSQPRDIERIVVSPHVQPWQRCRQGSISSQRRAVGRPFLGVLTALGLEQGLACVSDVAWVATVCALVKIRHKRNGASNQLIAEYGRARKNKLQRIDTRSDRDATRH